MEKETAKEFDVVGFIIEFESGGVSDETLIEGFQHLINNGMAWTLQGFYGRTANSLIEQGYCKPAGEWTPEDAITHYKEQT